jgi:hypothetical protein
MKRRIANSKRRTSLVTDTNGTRRRLWISGKYRCSNPTTGLLKRFRTLAFPETLTGSIQFYVDKGRSCLRVPAEEPPGP